MNVSHRSAAKSLWHIVFHFRGSIWPSVLPYCFLNCAIMLLLELCNVWRYEIAFSMSGHSLMTLIISYLIVAKINLSYDRYMMARHSIGGALSSLRELHQLVLAYSTSAIHRNNHDRSGETILAARKWRAESTERIIDLMDCMIRILKNERQAQYLARNDHFGDEDKKSAAEISSKTTSARHDDPLLHVTALRLHLTSDVPLPLELLEKMKTMDMLNDFVDNYRTLLELASTPMPFPLVQMARTFLFLWTFTIPFALRGVVEEFFVAMIFVFFLTFGFIGLELVAMKLLSPFGDGINDLNVTGMREATVRGLERDLTLVGDSIHLVGDRRLEFARQKIRTPSWNHPIYKSAASTGTGSSKFFSTESTTTSNSGGGILPPANNSSRNLGENIDDSYRMFPPA